MAESTASISPGEIVEVHVGELPFSCPSRNTDPAAAHPRVYIPLKEAGGRAVCPYCGTEYHLVE